MISMKKNVKIIIIAISIMLCFIIGWKIGDEITKTSIFNAYIYKQIEIYGEKRVEEEYKTHTLEKVKNGYLLTVYRHSGAYKYIDFYLVNRVNGKWNFEELKNFY